MHVHSSYSISWRERRSREMWEKVFKELTWAAERTEVNKRSAKPEEMQMTEEMWLHQDNQYFCGQLCNLTYQIGQAHGRTPLEKEKIQNREADHVWHQTIVWIYNQKCIPALLFKRNLHCVNDQREDNVAEQESTVDFNSTEMLPQWAPISCFEAN